MTDRAQIALLLPERLYAVVGQECNVYWDGVLRSPIPLDQFRYNAIVTLPGPDSSRQYAERWTMTPLSANVGEGSFTLDVHYGNDRVISKSAALRVREAQVSAPVTRRLLMIGDSTMAGGQALAELVSLCQMSGLTLTTVGTRSATFADAGGLARTIASEAVGGTTIAWHYLDLASAFVYGGVFNFSQFLSAKGVTLAAGDWVMVDLGINDVFNYTNENNLQLRLTEMSTRLSAMIASIQNAVSGIRIGLCPIIAPSASQDAFAQYYSGQTQWRYKRNRDLWVESLLTNWKGQEANGLYIVPIHTALDTHNNMQTSIGTLNARNATPVTRQSNGLHPDTSGYRQLSDALFAFLRGNEP